MPIRKAGPQTVHSKVTEVSKNNSHTSKNKSCISSLLDISEDEPTESAIPTISTSLLMTTNKNPQSILKFVLSFLG